MGPIDNPPEQEWLARGRAAFLQPFPLARGWSVPIGPVLFVGIAGIAIGGAGSPSLIVPSVLLAVIAVRRFVGVARDRRRPAFAAARPSGGHRRD